MGSAMSLTCFKRKATTQDVGSSSDESCKRRKICSSSTKNNDDDHCRLISDNQSCLSPPTSLSRNWNHPVFPSFHGADVRKTILSHILVSFKRKAIYPFIDDEIDRSKSIGPELIEAIRSSKIAMVLLSKNYASSSWCLNELAEIINCREVLGQTVMTVFYEVDPSDIRKQAGDFGNAFKRTCKGRTKAEIEKWSKALEEVATIAGEHSARWSNEAAMIEKIATDVFNKLTDSKPSNDFEDYVGMRAHMERMQSLLSLDSDEVRMVGIWGPPGIGKKTIARVAFNQLSSSFDHCAIMVDIKKSFPRPWYDEYDVKLQLQNQMLSQIIGQDIKISRLGVARELLKDKKVFLVINDVDHRGQLNALAENIYWFGSGSRIIITTEDRRLLKAHDIEHIYKVKYPSSDEAFQIFCMHAFRQQNPPDDGFYKLAKEVSYLAGELPLGLKVLGSALRGYKSKKEWEMILPRLRTSLHGEIESIIKFSYDALCDEDKYLFLYVSCFFNNYETILKVEEILASRFPDVMLGLHILTEKSLIDINNNGIIDIHDLVRQFGRETARKKFVRRELLFDERDICEVLTEDTTDSNHPIAINLNWKMIKEKLNISDKTLKKMADLQFIEIDGDKHDIYPCELELRSLIFHSRKIRSLEWWYFGNICLPSTFNTEFLVNLDMKNSKLEKLWEGDKVLKNLKWMDLSESWDLKELPDLSTATKLEELILYGCESLVELPDLPTATKLRKLDLSVCKSLVELPDLPTATKLRELDLCCCSSLVKLPSSFGNFNNLEYIGLSGCKCLVELPFYIGTATNLQSLYLGECSSLVEIPFSIGNLTNLQSLDLTECSSLVKLPSSIGNLINLQSLDLAKCSSLRKLPDLSTATKLEELILDGCKSFVELPDLPTATKLRKLSLHRCSSLVKLPSSFGNFNNLEKIDLSYCGCLVELPFYIGTATNLQSLDLTECSSLVKLPSSIGDLINSNGLS